MFNLAAVKNYIETKVIKGNAFSERKINELRAIIKDGACPTGPKGKFVNFRQKDDKGRNAAERQEAAAIRTYLKDKLQALEDLRIADQPKEVEKKEESAKAEIQPEIEFDPELEQENTFQALLISGIHDLEHKSLSDNLKALEENGAIIYQGEEDHSILHIRNNPQRVEFLKKIVKEVKSLIEKEKEAIKRLNKLGNRNLQAEGHEREKYEYEAFLSHVTKAIKESDKETLTTALEDLETVNGTAFSYEPKGSTTSEFITIKTNSNIISLLNSAIKNIQTIKSKKSQIIQEIQEISEKNIVSIKNAEALRFKEAQAFQDKTYVENLIKEHMTSLNYEGLNSILERSKQAGELKYSEEGRESLVIAFTPELENLLEDGLKEIQEKIKALEDLIEGKYPDGRMMPLDRRKELLQTILLEGKLNKGGKAYIESIPSHWKKLLEAKIEGLKAEEKALKDKQKEQKSAELLQQNKKKEQQNNLLGEGPRAQKRAFQVDPNPTSKVYRQEDSIFLRKGSDGSTERIGFICTIPPEATNSATEEELNELAKLKKECEILIKQEEHRKERYAELSKQLVPPYQLYPKCYVSKYNSCFPGIYMVVKGAENHPGPLEDQIEQYVRARLLLTTTAEMMRIPRECLDLAEYMLKIKQLTWYKRLPKDFAQQLKLLNEKALTEETTAWNIEDFEIAKKSCNELKKLLQQITELTLEGREELRLTLEQEIKELKETIRRARILLPKATELMDLDESSASGTSVVLATSEERVEELVSSLVKKQKELKEIKELNPPEGLPLTDRTKQLLNIKEMEPSSYDNYKETRSPTSFSTVMNKPASKIKLLDKEIENIVGKMDDQYKEKFHHYLALREKCEILQGKEKKLREKCNGRVLPDAIHEQGRALSAGRDELYIKMNQSSKSGLDIENQIKIYTEIIKNLKEAIKNWELAGLVGKCKNLVDWLEELNVKIGGLRVSAALDQKLNSKVEETVLQGEKAMNPLLKDTREIFTELYRLNEECIEILLEVREEADLQLQGEIREMKEDCRIIVNALANESQFTDPISTSSIKRIEAIIEEESPTKPITQQFKLHEGTCQAVFQKVLNELTIEIEEKQKKLKELREINVPEGLDLTDRSYELLGILRNSFINAAAGPSSNLSLFPKKGKSSNKQIIRSEPQQERILKTVEKPSFSFTSPKEGMELSKKQKRLKLEKLQKEYIILQQDHETWEINFSTKMTLPKCLNGRYTLLDKEKIAKIKELKKGNKINENIEIYEELINIFKEAKEIQEVAALAEKERDLRTYLIILKANNSQLPKEEEQQIEQGRINIIKTLQTEENPRCAKQLLIEAIETGCRLLEKIRDERLHHTALRKESLEQLNSTLKFIQDKLQEPTSYEAVTFSDLEQQLKEKLRPSEISQAIINNLLHEEGAQVKAESLSIEHLLKTMETNLKEILPYNSQYLKELKEENTAIDLALSSWAGELSSMINKEGQKKNEIGATASQSSSLAAFKEKIEREVSDEKKAGILADLKKEYKILLSRYNEGRATQGSEIWLPPLLSEKYIILQDQYSIKVDKLAKHCYGFDQPIKIYEELIASFKEIIKFQELSDLVQDYNNLSAHGIKLFEEIKDHSITNALYKSSDDLRVKMADKRVTFNQVQNLSSAKEILLELKEDSLKGLELVLEMKLKLVNDHKIRIKNLTSSLKLIQSMLKHPDSYKKMPFPVLEKKLKDLATTKDYTLVMFQIDSSMSIVSSESLLTNSLLKKIECNIKQHLEGVNKALKKLEEINIPEDLVLSSKSYELISAIKAESKAASVAGPSSSLAALREEKEVSDEEKILKLEGLKKEYEILQRRATDWPLINDYRLPVLPSLKEAYQACLAEYTIGRNALNKRAKIDEEIENYTNIIASSKEIIKFQEVADLVQDDNNLRSHAVKLWNEVKDSMTSELSARLKAIQEKARVKTEALNQARNPSSAKEILLELAEDFLRVSELLLEERLEIIDDCKKKIESFTTALELIQSMLKDPNSYEEMTFSTLQEQLHAIGHSEGWGLAIAITQIDSAAELVAPGKLLTSCSLKRIEYLAEQLLKEANEELEKLEEINIPEGLALSSKSYKLISAIKAESKAASVAGPSSSLNAPIAKELDQGKGKAL